MFFQEGVAVKHRFLCLLLALALLCSGCSRTDAPPQDTPPAQTPWQSETPSVPEGSPPAEETPSAQDPIDPLLKEFLSKPDIMETPVREYGENTSLLRMGNDLMVRILYPVGGLTQLDQEIERWALDTMEYYQAESMDRGTDADAAELTVEYCSYLVQGKVAGVKLSGVYDRPFLAHPIDVSASFNANLETGALLALSDILLPGGEEMLRKMVMEQAGVKGHEADENLLNPWLLTHDGLEITLVRGEYLPMSDGTVTLLYSYEELEGIIALPGGTEEPLPSPEPPVEVTPEPTPEPTPALPTQPPVQVTPSPDIDPDKPMLALTFDDGPSAHTERLLDAFAAHGGKGTFYVVGNMIDNRPNALRRMAAEGHEIGGHSWNHRQLTKLSREELTDQIMSTRAKIYEVTGVDPTTMRPPYGSYNDLVKEVTAELGIAMINWSVDTLDWKHKNADIVYKEVMDQAKDGAIILCHDLHKTTVEAMERAIPALIAEGYQLVTVSELLSSSGKTVQAGAVYFKG